MVDYFELLVACYWLLVSRQKERMNRKDAETQRRKEEGKGEERRDELSS
jgi:hypothetical protein